MKLSQRELIERYVLGAWFLKIRLMSSRRQLWAKEASLIHLENAALQFRKICEMISHMCIAASGLESGLISKSLKGYQVGAVLKALNKKGTLKFPQPARLTKQSKIGDDNDQWNLDIGQNTLEDISRIEFIHEQTHKILHEFSILGQFPNKQEAPATIYNNLHAMRVDHQWMWNRFWQHAILINNHLLFVDFGNTEQHECPRIIKHENLLKEDIQIEFDPDMLADFSEKIDWSEFDNETSKQVS